jgi:zinc protease
MRTGSVLRCALLGLLAGLALPAVAQTKPDKPLWAHLASDIAPDPAVKYGVLPNGMRYAILANKLPPGVVSIRFAFDVGSLQEAENEKGLAHFIEHMAFNGSTHVPEGEMVKILERLGLSFGADTNAQTSQTDTIYMLELPNASDNLIDESLFLMREVASELTFNADAIDRERGVVLSEYRRGDTFAKRRSEQQLDFLIPGAYANTRMPIGDAKVLETAPRDTLVSLYNRFYRPERATMVIVGDIDVAKIEEKIKAKFSDWNGKGEPGKDPDKSYTPKKREPAASVFQHEDGGDSVSVYFEVPFEDLPDTAAYRKESNFLNFANGIIARRFTVMGNAEDPPFRRAGLSYSDILEAVDSSSGSATVTPGGWKKGLQAVEQEWRRALLFGFTQAEIDEQVAAMRTDQTLAAQREGTRTTGQLTSQLLGSILDDSVFSTPSSGLKRFEGWAPSVTPASVHEVFKRRMAMTGAPLFFLQTSIAQPDAAKEIPAAWAESQKIAVTAPGKKSTARFAYTNFGKPGKVVKDARLTDIDTRELTFANNVRLNIKKTAFQKNSVQVSLRVGGGALELPEQPWGLSSLMGAYTAGGLEKHSLDDLRSIMAGHRVTTGFTASATAFGATYTTTPDDLLLQLQVATAFMTHPGYRPEAERRWRQNIVLSWPRLDADAQSVLGARGQRLLASGDKRFGTSPDDGVINRSFVELKAYLTPILKDAAIEIAIVGDVDEQKAIDAVAKTFGALPKRKPTSEFYRDDKPVVFRKERDPIVLTHAGEPDQALVNVYWPVTLDPDADPQAARVLSTLGTIMRGKILDVVREELGASYSPSATAALSSVYPGWGYIAAGTEIKPQDADRVSAALKQIAADLRAGKISDDEFSRAMTPALEQLPRNATSNFYWLSLISEAQGRPDRMDRSKLPAVEKSLKAITKTDVIAAAEKWLVGTPQEVRVLPAKTTKETTTPARTD